MSRFRRKLKPEQAEQIFDDVPRRIERELGSIIDDSQRGSIYDDLDVIEIDIKAAMSSQDITSMQNAIAKASLVFERCRSLRKGSTCKHGKASFDPDATCDAEWRRKGDYGSENFGGCRTESEYTGDPPGFDVLACCIRTLNENFQLRKRLKGERPARDSKTQWLYLGFIQRAEKEELRRWKDLVRRGERTFDAYGYRLGERESRAKQVMSIGRKHLRILEANCQKNPVATNRTKQQGKKRKRTLKRRYSSSSSEGEGDTNDFSLDAIKNHTIGMRKNKALKRANARFTAEDQKATTLNAAEEAKIMAKSKSTTGDDQELTVKRTPLSAETQAALTRLRDDGASLEESDENDSRSPFDEPYSQRFNEVQQWLVRSFTNDEYVHTTESFRERLETVGDTLERSELWRVCAQCGDDEVAFEALQESEKTITDYISKLKGDTPNARSEYLLEQCEAEHQRCFVELGNLEYHCRGNIKKAIKYHKRSRAKAENMLRLRLKKRKFPNAGQWIEDTSNWLPTSVEFCNATYNLAFALQELEERGGKYRTNRLATINRYFSEALAGARAIREAELAFLVKHPHIKQSMDDSDKCFFFDRFDSMPVVARDSEEISSEEEQQRKAALQEVTNLAITELSKTIVIGEHFPGATSMVAVVLEQAPFDIIVTQKMLYKAKDNDAPCDIAELASHNALLQNIRASTSVRDLARKRRWNGKSQAQAPTGFTTIDSSYANFRQRRKYQHVNPYEIANRVSLQNELHALQNQVKDCTREVPKLSGNLVQMPSSYSMSTSIPSDPYHVRTQRKRPTTDQLRQAVDRHKRKTTGGDGAKDIRRSLKANRQTLSASSTGPEHIRVKAATQYQKQKRASTVDVGRRNKDKSRRGNAQVQSGNRIQLTTNSIRFEDYGGRDAMLAMSSSSDSDTAQNYTDQFMSSKKSDWDRLSALEKLAKLRRDRIDKCQFLLGVSESAVKENSKSRLNSIDTQMTTMAYGLESEMTSTGTASKEWSRRKDIAFTTEEYGDTSEIGQLCVEHSTIDPAYIEQFAHANKSAIRNEFERQFRKLDREWSNMTGNVGGRQDFKQNKRMRPATSSIKVSALKKSSPGTGSVPKRPSFSKVATCIVKYTTDDSCINIMSLSGRGWLDLCASEQIHKSVTSIDMCGQWLDSVAIGLLLHPFANNKIDPPTLLLKEIRLKGNSLSSSHLHRGGKVCHAGVDALAATIRHLHSEEGILDVSCCQLDANSSLSLARALLRYKGRGLKILMQGNPGLQLDSGIQYLQLARKLRNVQIDARKCFTHSVKSKILSLEAINNLLM